MKLATIKAMLLSGLVSTMFLINPIASFAQEMAAAAPALVGVNHNVRGGNATHYLNEGDLLSLSVKAVGSVDVFVYVIYHDANGDSCLLFPNVKEKNNVVRAGQTRTVPGEDARIGFRIRSPFGKERLQVIASQAHLPELERFFAEAKAAEELNEWLTWIVEQPQVESQESEFETRPANGESEPLQSGPERAQ